MTPAEFRDEIKFLVHYAPANTLSNESLHAHGLRTASQIIEANTINNIVHAKFKCENVYRAYRRADLISLVRFKRGTTQQGSCVMVQNVRDQSKPYVLGDHYPLGRATFLKSCLPKDVGVGDWIAFLNSFFWVFDHKHVNVGLVHKISKAGGGACVKIPTASLPDDFIENSIRLSQINGGGSNGNIKRGYDSYLPPSRWRAEYKIKEIGIVNGIDTDLVKQIGLKVTSGA